MFASLYSKALSRIRREQSLRLGLAVLGAALLAPGGRAQSSSGAVVTLGGTGTAGYVDGVQGLSQFSNPQGVAIRGDQLFIADYGNNAVRALRLGSTLVSTFARGNGPVALAFDTSTNLFVANQGDSTVEQFDFFGNSIAVFRIPNVAGQITAMAIDRNDNLYIAQRRGVVLRLDTDRRVAAQYGTVANNRDFRGVAVFDDGSLYASDAANHVIWRLENGGFFTAYAGAAGQPGRTDGDLRFGRLNTPQQIASGPNGTLVVADRGNHKIRVVSCTGVLSTLYGVNQEQWFNYPGAEGVFPGWWDSSAQFAELRDPAGVAVSGNTVYDTETYYNLVRSGTGLAFPSCPTSGGGTSTNIVAPVVQLNPRSGFYPNGVVVELTASNMVSFPRETKIFYTVDGSQPTRNSAQAQIDADGVARIVLPGPVDLGGLRVISFLGALSSPVVTAEPTKVPALTLSPNAGYYPMGVDVSVRAAEGNFPDGTILYYTTDGTIPTTNSIPLAHNGTSATLAWHDASRDLRSLRVRAFLGPNAGATSVGQAIVFPNDNQTQGEIGIPPARNGFNAGIGSFYILPIVANLRDQQTLKSLQFLIELTAGNGAPRLERTDVQVLPMSTNDFIQIQPASLRPPDSTITTASEGVSRLAIAYFGTNSGFNVQGFATVAMLGIQFRSQDSSGTRADIGDEYTIRITQISGTSDGVQRLLPLKAMDARTIRLQNISFLEGDTSPAYWYNAGDFGNGMLENGDVNNAVFAAFGFRKPYDGTDAFAAMDVYRVGILENVIEYNDAATILRRSLGFESSNLRRSRNALGEWVQTVTGFAAQSTGGLRAQSVALNNLVWNRDVLIRGGTMQKAEPARLASVPVFMKARAGRSVTGMQFVADVVPANGASSISAVKFVPSSSLSAPTMNGSAVPGVGTLPATVYARWDNLDPGLAGEVLLGHIQFLVPAEAQLGQGYAIVFHHTGGASIDEQTGYLRGYLFETMRGHVWVGDSVVPDTQEASDEWREHFFGTALSPQSAGNLDADADGFTNLQEYLAGSNPSQADWSARVQGGFFTFRWVGEAGRKYTVESTIDFKGWNAAPGQFTGQDAFLEYTEPGPSAGARFYRLKVQ